MVVAVLAACGGDDEDPLAGLQASTTTTPTTAAETTEATAATTPTTLDYETEVRRAVIELLELRNEIYQQDPVNPARLDEYLAEGCRCRADELARLERFATEGLRWNGPVIDVLGVRIEEASDRRFPAMTVTGSQPDNGVVDATGTVLETFGEADLVAYIVALQGAPGGEWRISTLEPNPQLRRDIANQIVDEGLP